MDRLRILHFTSSLRTGGAEHHILDLCRYLRGAGHESAICTTASVEEGLEGAAVAEGVPLYRLPLRSLAALPAPRASAALRRIIAGARPDILHGHLFHGEAVAAWARTRTRAPLVVTRHSAGLEFGGWRRVLARLYGRGVARCVAVSREAADEARRMGYPAARIAVLPNAVDARRFHPLEPGDRERRRGAFIAELFPGESGEGVTLVGSVGGLKPVKGHALLIEAAARLVAKGREGGGGAYRFVIVGEGPERLALERRAREAGVDRLFALPGARGDVDSVVPLLDVFVLPSRTEGVPLALLEAMSSGVACVASDVGGVGEALGEAGILVPPGDVEGFAAAARRLAEDGAERAELGRRARVRALERYDIEIWGERMLAIYREALAESARRGGAAAGEAAPSGPGRAEARGRPRQS